MFAFQLDKQGKDPEKILSFANRALTIFDQQHENEYCLYIVMILRLLGSIYDRLRKFNDALGFLNRAKKLLLKLENDSKPILHAEGTMEAVVDKMRNFLENHGFSLEEKESKEFGNANRQFAEACVEIKNFKDGLLYCLKALEIHLRLLGENSVEVAHDRRVLQVIYTGMDEYEKALEENRLAQKIFKNCGCNFDLVHAVIDAANMYIDLGMYEAAMNTLMGVGRVNENRFRVLLTMGKVLVYQEKFDDAKRCLEIACSVLDKKEKSKPLEVSGAYNEIAFEYQTMNDFENAISLLKRALALLEKLPDQQHLELEASLSGRTGLLLLLTDKVTEAIPYLERAAETVKETVGSKHFVAGYIYNNLGADYLELKRPQSAAQMFSAAQDIMDASSLGPHHNDSIHACQNLSKAYAAMKSYPLAIELQQKAVDAWEGHGSSEEDELREARQLLNQLKAIARGASSKDFPTKALPLPYWAYKDAMRGLQVPQPSSPKQSG